MGHLPENPNVGLTFDEKKLHEIYLAGGCFWGVEAYLERIYGVYQTEVGYANGNTKNPSYEEVCTKNTNHAETVKVIFDESKITLNELLDSFFKIINPTSINRQGNDRGSQYRTGIYFIDEMDQQVAIDYINQIQVNYRDKIVVEVTKLDNYYRAEDYHQKYLEHNPNGYCHLNLSEVLN